MSAGEMLLDDVETFLSRFVAFPSDEARVATVLWVVHTHCLDVFETTPRLAFLSPEPGSGKTRALDILELVCPRALHAVNCTPAALFRSVGSPDGRPTVLYDEIDTVFGPRAKENEDIRGMLNAGYRRGAKALRCVIKGKTVEVEEIDAYAAVALAGLGDLPDTIMTRSIVVRMRRRAPHERIEPYRRRVNAAEGEALRDEVAAWAATVSDRVGAAWPPLPEGVEDRNAECWEPLLAIADEAGGTWPTRARVAAVALVALLQDKERSLGIRLLADLRDIFTNDDKLTTETVIERLVAVDEGPWGELRRGQHQSQPIDARRLARMLKDYGIKPKVLRIGDATPRGYERGDLLDAWSRYLTQPSPQEGATTATSATTSVLTVPDAVTVADAWVAHEAPQCQSCGQALLLSRPGRDTCERCRVTVDAPVREAAS